MPSMLTPEALAEAEAARAAMRSAPGPADGTLLAEQQGAWAKERKQA